MKLIKTHTVYAHMYFKSVSHYFIHSDASTSRKGTSVSAPLWYVIIFGSVN